VGTLPVDWQGGKRHRGGRGRGPHHPQAEESLCFDTPLLCAVHKQRLAQLPVTPQQQLSFLKPPNRIQTEY